MSQPRTPYNVLAELLEILPSTAVSPRLTPQDFEADLKEWFHGVVRALVVREQAAEKKRSADILAG